MSGHRFWKLFVHVLFSAARNISKFSDISWCWICTLFKPIKTYFMQQNSVKRDKTSEKLCPDIDCFRPNVHRQHNHRHQNHHYNHRHHHHNNNTKTTTTTTTTTKNDSEQKNHDGNSNSHCINNKKENCRATDRWIDVRIDRRTDRQTVGNCDRKSYWAAGFKFTLYNRKCVFTHHPSSRLKLPILGGNHWNSGLNHSYRKKVFCMGNAENGKLQTSLVQKFNLKKGDLLQNAKFISIFFKTFFLF